MDLGSLGGFLSGLFRGSAEPSARRAGGEALRLFVMIFSCLEGVKVPFLIGSVLKLAWRLSEVKAYFEYDLNL